MGKKKRARHVEPHFNAAGGCLCSCSRCINVRLSPPARPGGSAVIYSVCCCGKCSNDCPSEGRLVNLAVAVTR